MNNLIARFLLVIYLTAQAASAIADETAALTLFNQMNAIDITGAHIALARSQSTPVKNLANMIINDHEPIQQEVNRMTNALGLKLPAISDNKAYANTLNALKSITINAFDQAYLTHELEFSKDFIDKLKTEILPALTHNELKTYFAGLVPKFEAHFMHIQHTEMMVK